MTTISKTPTLHAIQNTAHVLEAVEAYKRSRSQSETDRAATAVAIEAYKKTAGKIVSPRTIRLWLAAVRNYGGSAKTPKDAFGGKLSRPHSCNGRADKTRAIQDQCDWLLYYLKHVKKGDIAFDLGELASIDRALRECVHLALGCQGPELLASIKENGRLMETAKSARVRKHLAGIEGKTALGDILERLEKLTRHCPEVIGDKAVLLAIEQLKKS